jgi:hypothetical protein
MRYSRRQARRVPTVLLHGTYGTRGAGSALSLESSSVAVLPKDAGPGVEALGAEGFRVSSEAFPIVGEAPPAGLGVRPGRPDGSVHPYIYIEGTEG